MLAAAVAVVAGVMARAATVAASADSVVARQAFLRFAVAAPRCAALCRRKSFAVSFDVTSTR